jgi:hypothetical protein
MDKYYNNYPLVGWKYETKISREWLFNFLPSKNKFILLGRLLYAKMQLFDEDPQPWGAENKQTPCDSILTPSSTSLHK